MITSTLYQSITNLGEDGSLARDFADIFAWDVDFQRKVRPGDSFQILYERLYREVGGRETYVRPGRILAAKFQNQSGEYTAVYFESRDGSGGYYRPDGSSVEGAFLMAPMRHARITSSFSSARRHPILKITRPASRDRLRGLDRHAGLVGRRRRGDPAQLDGRQRESRQDPPRERLRLLVRAPLALCRRPARGRPGRAEAGDRLRGPDRARDRPARLLPDPAQRQVRGPGPGCGCPRACRSPRRRCRRSAPRAICCLAELAGQRRVADGQ